LAIQSEYYAGEAASRLAAEVFGVGNANFGEVFAVFGL
jgi:hypothetical protein